MTFLFKVVKGKIDFGSSYNRARFKQELKDNEGKEYRIEKLVHTRTMSQNALYWLYLGVIERETGNASVDLHEYFKRMFLPPRYIKVLGKEIKIPSSTKDLNKIEFGEYIDKISAETEVPIPDTESFKEWRDSSPLRDEKYEDT